MREFKRPTEIWTVKTAKDELTGNYIFRFRLNLSKVELVKAVMVTVTVTAMVTVMVTVTAMVTVTEMVMLLLDGLKLENYKLTTITGKELPHNLGERWDHQDDTLKAYRLFRYCYLDKIIPYLEFREMV